MTREKLLTAKQVADILGIEISTIYDWVYRKKLSYIKIGSLLKFDPTTIEDYIEKNTKQGRF